MVLRAGASVLIALLVNTPASAETPGGGATEPPADAVLGSIPFEDGPATRILVNLAPEDSRPMVLMLDTGAAGSVLTPGMARSLGVSIRRTKSTPYRRKTLLGRDLQFWIDTQSSDTGSSSGFDYGLLGGDFLDDYVVELDYPKRRVRFLDPRKFRLPEAATAENERVVPFRRSGPRIVTEIEINGHSGQVLLDTGSPSALLLSGKSAEKYAIDVDALPVSGRIAGVVGETEVRFYESRNLRWAGYSFDVVPVEVAPRGFFNQGGNTDSLLGYDVLRQFTIRIDYKRKRLWLRRGDDHHMTHYGAKYPPSTPGAE